LSAVEAAVDRLNGIPAAELERELMAIFASRAWARRLAAARPLAGVAALESEAERALAALPFEAWRDAVEELGDWPIPACDDGTRSAAEVAQALYRERFGWRFVTAHENLTGEQLLMRIRIRLGHEEPAELRKSRAEHAMVVCRTLRRRYADGA
jgi:2-oxo-4-hydroxy-4-carboxy-5-ureidoimidazoline decarboxylase